MLVCVSVCVHVTMFVIVWVCGCECVGRDRGSHMCSVHHARDDDVHGDGAHDDNVRRGHGDDAHGHDVLHGEVLPQESPHAP